MFELFDFIVNQPASPPVYHSYLSNITAVIVGAAVAFWYTKYINKSNSEKETLSEFSSDLKEILLLCENYWLWESSVDKTDDDLKKLGYILSARLLATAEYRPLIKKLMDNKFDDFDALDTKLTIVATGGNFQTTKMSPEPHTYQQICSIVYKTELILRELRSRR